MGAAELRSIIAEQGQISVHCHYCNTDYVFTPAETEELINKIYDGSADKLFAALLGRKKLSARQIEKLKEIVGEEE